MNHFEVYWPVYVVFLLLLVLVFAFRCGINEQLRDQRFFTQEDRDSESVGR